MTAARKLIVKALQATRLNKVAHRIYYSRIHGFNTANPALLPALTRVLEDVAGDKETREGDYYEFGVFKGYAFLHAQHEARRLGLDSMRFFGFDSFEGLPEVDGVDATAHGEFYKGQYACGKDEVVRNLDARGVDWDRTFLVEGYFDRSLTAELRARHQMKPAAVALVDCDLYSSTRDVLQFLDTLIRPGSILLMDDWNCFDGDDNKGQRRAFKEFLAGRPGIATKMLFPYGAWGQVIRIERLPEAE